MTRAELYKLWAPDESIWTKWAKPVLFADSSFDNLPLSDPPGWRMLNLPWASSLARDTVVVADLPGLESIKVGMVLSQTGFRPVPLFNGAAGPMMGTMAGALPLVDVYPFIRGLHAVAEDLMALRLPPNAPPVFLLDANRFNGGSFANPGRFDNRWSVFPQDFPSANFLLSQNIRAVVLVQENSAIPRHDLTHVLLRWQEAGVQILSTGVSDEKQPVPIQVAKPGSFRALWYRAMVLAGLRRNSAGGFGAVIPMPSSSGGYG
jgi:hypothetical protein